MNQPLPTQERVNILRSIGPALITACVVFGPGSLIISANVGATYGYDLVWLLVLTGLLMGTFMTMSARVGVTAGSTHFATLRREVNGGFAALAGIVLCLVCAAFQFSNNLAVALVAGAFVPEQLAPEIRERSVFLAQFAAMAGLNALLILFLFRAQQVYKAVERIMKFMVGVVLLSFLFNLLVAFPDLRAWGIGMVVLLVAIVAVRQAQTRDERLMRVVLAVILLPLLITLVVASPPLQALLKGLLPGLPAGLELRFPRIVGDDLVDPMVLIASLVGTTFSVAGAFFQGNLVRERGWTFEDYDSSVGDAIAGVCVLTCVSMMIMVTAGTVILGEPASNIATLALTMQPLLGQTAFVVFCIGLIPIALNPFLINAMIGGTALADGLGFPGRFSDFWPRMFTIGVLIVGFIVATVGLWYKIPPVNLMIFGQAMTVIGNPLLAATILWLANRKSIMGERRNRIASNLLGAIGLTVVLLLTVRMLWFLYLRISLLAG
jgi:manganese transport protein